MAVTRMGESTGCQRGSLVKLERGEKAKVLPQSRIMVMHI